MKFPNYYNYAEEKQKWIDAGKPIRPDDKIDALFQKCSSNECNQYISIGSELGQCGICTCILRPSKAIGPNKLKWATTQCPLGLWSADATFIENTEKDQPIQDIVQKTEPIEQTPPPSPLRPPEEGCGCT